MRGRMARWWPGLWAAVLVLLVLAPTLGAGYVLSYDMVFVPRQDLLPAALGLTEGLPRAVPQDAVVAVLTTAVPGWLVQKAALVGALLGAGLGAARLLRGSAAWARALAATLYVWNAYVAERLVQGHWGLLVAFAVLPWALAAACDVRRGVAGAVPRLVLLLALGALTPTGGVLVAVVAVPVVLLPRSAAAPRTRVGAAVTALAVNAPWWLPAVLAGGSAAADPAGVGAFALRGEGPWGALLTALGTGGIWNADAVPASRGWWTAPALAAALVVAGAYGLRPLARRVGTAAVAWLAGVAAAGTALAIGSAFAPGAVGWLGAVLPGGGLLRDAQKWLAPLVLVLALAGALGSERAVARVPDRQARGAVAVLLLVLPVVALPDLAWGVAGRLSPVAYPSGWQRVRDVLAQDPAPGDLAVLPWSAFRTYAWNGGRTVLDPAPRWSPRPSVVDDTLLVARPGGGVTRVSGEDPRSAAVAAALRSGRPLGTTLPPLGIGWVLVEVGQRPEPAATLFAGLAPVLDDGQLRLYRLAGDPVPWPVPAWAPGVVAVDVGVLLLVVGAGLATGLAAVRRRRGPDSGTLSGRTSGDGTRPAGTVTPDLTVAPGHPTAPEHGTEAS